MKHGFILSASLKFFKKRFSLKIHFDFRGLEQALDFYTISNYRMMMFGISFLELSVVLVVCFILVGPKKMTELAYELGIWFGKIKTQLHAFKDIKNITSTPFEPVSLHKPFIETQTSDLKKEIISVDVEEKEAIEPPRLP